MRATRLWKIPLRITPLWGTLLRWIQLRSAAAIMGSALLLALPACSVSSEPAASASPSADSQSEKALTVFATTGYLADAVANVAPEAVVTTMVGPGGDPHTYQPSTRDIVAMHDSDLVLWNGLHLEAQMIDQLTSLGDRQFAVGDAIPKQLLLEWPQTDADGTQLHDPHIWNSPEAWSIAVEGLAEKLGDIDPSQATEYTANARTYRAEIDEAAATAATQFAQIPKSDRTLISGHDAFGYLGKTYDLDVHATDFISSEAVLSPAELSDLADLIVTRHIPVIFQDNQANPQAISSLREAVRSRGFDVTVSGAELYADSLGADADVDTYLEVFEHNTRTIAAALADPADNTEPK